MEGHNRALSHGDIKSPVAKYTFHGMPRSVRFGYFVLIHMNILLQISHMCYGHEMIVNNLSQKTKRNVFMAHRIILTIIRIIGGISKDKNRITGRLAPASPAIKAITLPVIT